MRQGFSAASPKHGSADALWEKTSAPRKAFCCTKGAKCIIIIVVVVVVVVVCCCCCCFVIVLL